MGKTTRQRYLDAVVDKILSEGRADLPLVALADAAGTSDRMLVYYFKTRDSLLTEAVDAIRRRRRRRIAAMVDAVATSSSPAAGLHAVFDWVLSDENAADVRLLFGAAGDGFRGEAPYSDFLSDAISDWIEEGALAASRLGANQSRATTFGTLLAALATSLAADHLATGDRARVDAAVDAATTLLLDTIREGDRVGG